uniref:Uncharacterized protein n=1 Tax=uncultured Desulfobacterium sp. TaxID=201089 RepID=E1YEC8_9BACT|nr:unknown protein [uncultured Desulfobacterium sp.]
MTAFNTILSYFMPVIINSYKSGILKPLPLPTNAGMPLKIGYI